MKELGARRIGLLGGTFNPVHIGHLRAALEVVEFLRLDELRLVPSARPPHRETPQVSAEQRLAMVALAVADEPALSVDDRELRRDKPSYTVDTLESLRAELAADDQVFLLLGWDAFCGLPSWHRWQELLDHCHLLALAGPGGQISFIWQNPLAISATQIRQLLAVGRSVRFLLPDAVLAYIHAHGLYRAPNA
jgi:nicotinate-nucleotide adenylyltransferase